MANNEENIKGHGFHEMTAERQRAISQMGVDARKEKAARRKSMREWAEVFGSMPIDVATPQGERLETDMDGAVVFGQYQKAIKEKNSKAAHFIADLKGELVKRVDVQGVPVVVLPDSEVETINKLAK